MATEVTPEVEHFTGELKVMDPQHGDLRFQWDTSRPHEVEAARAAFDSAKGKGMVAHTVDSEGGVRTGQIVRDFDPQAGTLVMRPQMQGG